MSLDTFDKRAGLYATLFITGLALFIILLTQYPEQFAYAIIHIGRAMLVVGVPGLVWYVAYRAFKQARYNKAHRDAGAHNERY